MRLLAGLETATRGGKLEWQDKATVESSGLSGIGTLSFALSKGKTFVATKSHASYELSSAAMGRAPYELQVSEFNGTRPKPVGTLTSTTLVTSGSGYELNSALQRLFTLVDASVEPSERIVDRLLDDLGL